MTLLNKNINNIIEKYRFTYENLLDKYNKSTFNDNCVYYIEELILKCVNNKYIGFYTNNLNVYTKMKKLINEHNLDNIINVDEYKDKLIVYIDKLKYKGQMIQIEDLLLLE